MSDKYDSVNERTQEISESMKLCILGVWQNAHKFVRQLAMFCMLSSLCVLFYLLLYIGLSCCNHLIL